MGPRLVTQLASGEWTAMYLRLDRVARYARGTAPYLGIPVYNVNLDKYVTIVFQREHLRAAVESATAHNSRVVYDCDTNMLAFNGTPRASWRLFDLKTRPGTKGACDWKWFIGDALRSWAALRRKRKATARPDRETIYVKRLHEAIGKLQRQRERVENKSYLPHAVIEGPNINRHASNYERDYWRRWVGEKPLRRKLGLLATAKRNGTFPGTWGQFYKVIAEVLGRPITYTHERVCHLKNGPSRDEYLRLLYKNCSLTSKPGAYAYTPDPERFTEHRERLAAYANTLRELKAIDSQIAQHRLTISEVELQTSSPVVSTPGGADPA